jgi:ApaG protein
MQFTAGSVILASREHELAPMNKYAVEIEVTPQYLADQSSPDEGVYAFAYTVRIGNQGTIPVQLISRHWMIDDAMGRRQEVKGLGVVGHQPLLRPGEKFEYTSGCPLPTKTGSMQGSFFFVAEDGERFDAPIPEFALRTPGSLH